MIAMNTIVLISDDNYVLPTVVMIESIVDNYNREKDLQIYVMSWRLSGENILRINSLSRNNIIVKALLVDPDEYKDRMNLINQNTHVTPTALLKFEIANILKSEDMALYLDGDMVCKKDLSPLFETNMGDNYVAASFEFLKYVANKYALKENTKIPFYFNSGVMLLNLKKMREDEVANRLWSVKFKSYNKDSHGKGGLMDQDTFNEVCAEKVIELPIIYNCNCNFVGYQDLEAINSIYHTEFNTAEQMENQTVIIHFVGKTDKPWKYEGVMCQSYWDTYYKQLGMSLEALNRVKPKRNASFYIGKIRDSINSRGVINTLRYYFDKLIVNREKV